ncbi:MAG: DUF3987 domain-containing protein [Lentisphaerae bacterium]|nr:DUF3987 domain-containing protein [Lentisphaerota bacterium]
MGKKKDNRKQTLLFEQIEKNEEARKYVSDVLSFRKEKTKINDWRGVIAVPPGSILDSIIGQFYQNTNIPLEIPFFLIFHILSGYLLSNDVILEDQRGEIILPDFWTVILASSGAGKTWSFKSIRNALSKEIENIEFDGTGIVSSAAFIKKLSQQGKGLWIRDEFLQFLNSIQSNGPMSEIKDYLLRIYDNEKITRETKKDTYTINEPALTILGFNVTDTFTENIPVDNLIDGFAQRFGYCIADKDPNRNFLDYPIWSFDPAGLDQKWNKIVSNIHKKYKCSSESQYAFIKAFRSLYKSNIDESFYRRIFWRANKYALVYHIIREKVNNILDEEDYAWAARALSMHIEDAGRLLAAAGMSELEKIIIRGEKSYHQLIQKGEKPTIRRIMQNVRSISNMSIARFVWAHIDKSVKT